MMGDTQNFIHDKYREKVSRYSIYRVGQIKRAKFHFLLVTAKCIL